MTDTLIIIGLLALPAWLAWHFFKGIKKGYSIKETRVSSASLEPHTSVYPLSPVADRMARRFLYPVNEVLTGESHYLQAHDPTAGTTSCSGRPDGVDCSINPEFGSTLQKRSACACNARSVAFVLSRA